MRGKITLIASLFIFLFIFSACKSKQESYQASYDTAKSKPTVYVVEEMSAAEKPVYEEPEQKERLTTISGPAVSAYSVVIGSFVNRTNATGLQERMERQGYTPTLARNEKGMYRVILSTFKDESSAQRFKNEIIKKYDPDFFDAWVLEQE